MQPGKGSDTGSELPPEVRFMMEKFGLDEEKARLAIRDGFRVGSLMDGSAMARFMDDSGINARVNRMKRETEIKDV